MTNINNLNTPNVPKLERRVSKVESGAPMNNAGVGRSGFEVYDGGTINVSNGSIIVNGALTGGGIFDWTGSLAASGVNDFTGTNNLSGENHLLGPTDVAGDLDLIAGGLFRAGESEIRPDGSAKFGTLNIESDGTLTSGDFELNPDGSAKFGLFDIAANGDLTSKGTLDIDGVTTLKKDLNVTTGKIKVGALTIEPIAGGQLNFTDGAISRSGTFGMLANDAIAVELAAPVVKLSGANVQLPNLPSTTSAANVYFDPVSKRLYYKA